MNGEWLIRQARLEGDGTGYRTERVTIETTASGTDPILVDAPQAMTFHYTDGRILTFPHANIIRAEYRPHPQP